MTPKKLCNNLATANTQAHIIRNAMVATELWDAEASRIINSTWESSIQLPSLPDQWTSAHGCVRGVSIFLSC